MGIDLVLQGVEFRFRPQEARRGGLLQTLFQQLQELHLPEPPAPLLQKRLVVPAVVLRQALQAEEKALVPPPLDGKGGQQGR